MFNKDKVFAIFAVFLCLNLNNLSTAETTAKVNTKYPDYAFEYLGKDKFENFNRKVFMFNGALNKYAVRPITVIWASLVPKYGMDRIESAYTNIIYPRRLVSTLMQKDFKASKKETLRFLANTTLGLGGMYDPAKRYFKLEPAEEDMEQALSKYKVKQGPYLVIPILSSSSPRNLMGKALDASLDPSSYIGTPVLAIVKAGLLVNRTSFMQPFSKMIESTYADPYDIMKKLYGLEKYIKESNLDRKEVIDTTVRIFDDTTIAQNLDDITLSSNNLSEDNPQFVNVKNFFFNNQLINEIDYSIKSINSTSQTENKVAINDVIPESDYSDDIVLEKENLNDDTNLSADITLQDYNPQAPVTDSMRTALFELPGVNDSIWTELSVWNRCFSKRIRTSSINIDPERDNYKYRYIMQKDKNAPVAIIYPSIGEGIMSHHSVILAKLFFDEGYSVIIQGSNFQWEFVKSMPKTYRPGMPAVDAEYLRKVTGKILSSLQDKYRCKFREKVVIGTSFGALTTLFMAEKESENNTMNISRYISINPPIELMYAIKQIDKNSEEWSRSPSELKDRVAITAAKIIQVARLKKENEEKIETLPFSEDEAKLITGFIMHQKLSDLIFTIEDAPQTKRCDIYKTINNMNYHDYAEKYLVSDNYHSIEDMDYDSSLHSISDFLRENNNYKIYHTLNDYLVNHEQLKKLKEYSGNKVVLLNNGAHLGFLYRQEFIDELKKDISLDNKDVDKI